MAIGSHQRSVVDKTLKAIRMKATEIRTTVWREGATTDPRAILTGMDMIFEMVINLETMLVAERMAALRMGRKSDQ